MSLDHSDDALADLHRRFQHTLHLRSAAKETPRGLYDPIEYTLNLGGKRVRPLLALIAAKIYGDDTQGSLGMPIALAVEVFHNFTLVHDDVMDQSPLRRGQPTVHERWDLNTAILSGDMMLIRAYTHLAELGHTGRLPELIEIFNRVARQVCEGQQYDVDFEGRRHVTIDEYLRMIELKTAVLLGGALEMGARAAGASADQAGHLFTFGKLTGLVFQLQDDLLDTFGDSAQTGKLTGNDIIRNKKTFLYIKTYAGLNEQLRAEMEEWFSYTPEDPTEKVRRVTELMRQGEIPRLVAELCDDLQQQAYRHLAQAGGDEQWKRQLRQLTESLLHRSS